MPDFDNIADQAEDKVVAYLDQHAKVARTAAWVCAGIQLLLAFVIGFGSVNSLLAAFACFVTACIVVWLLVKTRAPKVLA